MIRRIAGFMFLVMAAAAMLTGCATAQPNVAAVPIQAHKSNQLRPVAAEPRDEGSLYSEGSSINFYRDIKAYRAGDIVTVNIVETSQASKQAATQLGRESELSAGISGLFGFQAEIPHNNKVAFDPTSLLGAKYSSSFKGSGTTSRRESMTAQISARVIQVLNNGDLVIRGSREITVNYEKQYIILEGIIRPTDITSNNTILSSYIADARIQYTGKGVLTAKQRPGWLSRLITNVWPF